VRQGFPRKGLSTGQLYHLQSQLEKIEDNRERRLVIERRAFVAKYRLKKSQIGRNKILARLNQGKCVNVAYVNDALRDDKEIALLSVSLCGRTLEFFSERLKVDRDVVFAAVSEDALALDHVGKEMKNNTDLLLTSIANNGNIPDADWPKIQVYMESLALARRSLIVFLFGAKYQVHTRTAPYICVLAKLNSHGSYFARKSKRIIAEFTGAPIGAVLKTLNKAMEKTKVNYP
jgi:hypothetical protein